MKTTNQEMSPLFDVSPDDAIGMLVADHKRVANLFADFKRMTEDGQDEDKASVVAQICRELTVHTQLEEEIFYPAVRAAIDDDDQMDEAVVEHAGAKELIAQLEAAAPEDALYDAKVTVLGEQIDHHVDEEEKSMFPKARHSGLDTLELGAAMLERKAQILGGVPSAPAPARPSAPHRAAPDEADETDEDDDFESAPRKPRPPVKKKAVATKSKATKPPAKKKRR